MRQRHYINIFLLTLVCLSLLQIIAWWPLTGHVPTASAYSFVIGSDPVDGSTINQPPAVVRIYFAAPPGALSQVSVYAFQPDGPANGLLVSAGPGVINATNSRELDTPLLPATRLPQGSYEVRWIAVSTTDGRTTSGLIGFNLGQSSVGLAGSVTLGPSTSNYFPQFDLQGALSTAWDWLVLLALCFWVGILLVDFFLLPRAASSAFLTQTRKHSRSLQMLCLIVLLVGEMINLILRATSFTQTLGSGGIHLDILGHLLLGTSYGYLWLLRMVLLALALFLLWWRGSHQPAQAPVVAAPIVSRTTRRGFGQLRQQARPDVLPELAAWPGPVTRPLARITGAMAAVTPPTRGMATTSSRITGNRTPAEVPEFLASPWQMTGWLVLAGLIILTLALSNEIVQLTPMPISAGVFSWLSLAAQATWFGSLAYLGFVWLPLLPTTNPDHQAETLVNILKRALPLFLIAIAVLLVSDLFLSEATLQAPAQLVNDPYGRALLIRASLLVLMLIFTGYLLLILLPRLQRQEVLLPVVDAEMPAKRARKFALERTVQTMKRALNTLSCLAAVTLICLALMNFFAPPVVFPNVNYAAQSSASGSTSATSQTQQAANLSATLQVLPARTGQTNTVILTLVDAQGKPVSNAQVKFTVNMQIMDMGTASANVTGGSPVYEAVFTARQAFSMAGAWSVAVEIDRPNQQAVHLTFQVMVQ
jgi:putative copper export protein/methionine-rich copper-binding protein CopC